MIKLLYRDKHIVAVEKPAGLLSAPAPDGGEYIGKCLAEQLSCDEPYLIHRLDRNVSGLMLMALRKEAAGKFSALISERSFTKEYLAVVHGVPEEPSGIYRDLLFRDSGSNKTYVTEKMRKGVKDASLEYRVLASKDSDDGMLSLVHIKLHTGRTHQIRAQFSSRKTPLFGDGKYGSHTNRGSICLHSAGMLFIHPFTKKELRLISLPDAVYPWSLFENVPVKDIFSCPVTEDADKI